MSANTAGEDMARSRTRHYVESYLRREVSLCREPTGHGSCRDCVVMTVMVMCEDNVRGGPPVITGDRSLSSEALPRDHCIVDLQAGNQVP
jgi:hypothetical protein